MANNLGKLHPLLGGLEICVVKDDDPMFNDHLSGEYDMPARVIDGKAYFRKSDWPFIEAELKNLPTVQ